MPLCPFAEFDELNGGVGPYLSGPFKIVHHTTEGDDYPRNTYLSNRSEPHFTVTASRIIQHIDTSQSARSLFNAEGGVQTNRDSAIQIEVVARAARRKDARTLNNVARLCRWIEETHGVPRVWPNGFPKVSVNGGDPGGHNRNSINWNTQGGHYGHCHVPENDHWDPGYTPTELSIVMGLQKASIAVNNSLVSDAEGHIDFDGRPFAWVRPVIEKMGGAIVDFGPGRVTLLYRESQVLFPVRGVENGKAFIYVGELRALPGVQVSLSADHSRVDVTSN